MHSARQTSWPLVCLGLMLVLGCSSGPRKHKVTGQVSLDGKAIPSGDILFVSENKANGPTPGKITNGAYEVMAFEGKNRVEISAAQIRPGGAKGAGGEPVPEEYIPESFNTQSILKAEVTSQSTRFDFPLDGKKR